MAPVAHIRRGGGGDGWEPHGLDDHLKAVAALAGELAAAFAPREWATLAGLWHDLGKFQPDFQRYIASASGFDAHIETAPGKVKHAIAGAIHAVDTLGLRGQLLAYLIAGHHAGPLAAFPRVTLERVVG